MKNLTKVEHFCWCSPLVKTWFIIMKFWGSIPNICNLYICLKGKGR